MANSGACTRSGAAEFSEPQYAKGWRDLSQAYTGDVTLARDASLASMSRVRDYAGNPLRLQFASCTCPGSTTTTPVELLEEISSLPLDINFIPKSHHNATRGTSDITFSDYARYPRQERPRPFLGRVQWRCSVSTIWHKRQSEPSGTNNLFRQECPGG